jgi:hypothetical protein
LARLKLDLAGASHVEKETDELVVASSANAIRQRMVGGYLPKPPLSSTVPSE